MKTHDESGHGITCLCLACIYDPFRVMRKNQIDIHVKSFDDALAEVKAKHEELIEICERMGRMISENSKQHLKAIGILSKL